MLPEWAPNLHPLIVHFPISLLAAAALVDLAGLYWRTSRGVRLSAVLLYCAGALGALAAYITGNRAADVVDVPTEAISVLNTHQDLAFYTLLFFGIYAVVRIALFSGKSLLGKSLLGGRDLSLAWRAFVVVVGIGGQVLVWQTGELGGKLVFSHGIGVGAVDQMSGELEKLKRRLAATQAAPDELEGGGFRWIIGPGADAALAEAFAFVEGSPKDLTASVKEGEEGPVLTLTLDQDSVLFVAGSGLGGVDAEAVVDATGFSGSVALVHNVQSRDTYHYLRLADEAVLGRLTGGEDKPMGRSDIDSSNAEPNGWTSLRATGDQGHFYGYVDGTTVSHGHSAEPAPGPAGLRLVGSGTLRLRRLEARSVQ